MDTIAASKTLLLGLAAALLVGLVASAAQTTVEGRPDTSPMTVPAGRVGDEVLYVWYAAAASAPAQEAAMDTTDGRSRTSGTTSTAPVVDSPPAPGYVVVRGQAFRMEEATQTADRAGIVHDVVRVREGSLDEAQPRTSYQYLDLWTRDAIRTDTADETERAALGRSSFGIHEPSLPGARLQGRTLTLGQDLSTSFPPRGDAQGFGMAAAYAVDAGLASSSVKVWSAAPQPGIDGAQSVARVVDRALVDGRDAYAVRHEVVVPLAAWAAAYGALPPDAQDDGELRFVRTSWVTADSAYPVLVDVAGAYDAKDGPRTFVDTKLVLGAYTRGEGDVVAWGKDRADQHYLPHNDRLERTAGSQAYPADGAGSRLPYPLAAALVDVDADPTLVSFRAWRIQNPDAVLAGALTRPGQAGSTAAATQVWDLVFALPSGDAYEVSVERAPGAPRGIARDHGPLTVDAFSVSDLPRNPVTLAAAQQIWAGVAASTYKASAPNYAQWGLDAAYRAAAPAVRAPLPGGEADAQLRRLDVGHVDAAGALSPASDGASVVSIAADTGLVEEAWEYRSDFAWTDPPRESGRAYASPQEHRVYAGLQPPTVERAAVASTGVMAAFLAVYFLPLLKFAGTQLLLLVPGYSKLAKDNILDNRVREQLLEAIKANPGIHASDLARRVDAGWGTVVYHLSILEKNKMVSSLVDGRHKRFFPVGVVDFGKRGQLAVLMNPTTKHLFALIQETPGIITGELARHVGVTLPSTMWHLRRLEDVGLVGRAKRGRKVHYYANEGASTAPEPPYDPASAVEVA